MFQSITRSVKMVILFIMMKQSCIKNIDTPPRGVDGISLTAKNESVD